MPETKPQAQQIYIRAGIVRRSATCPIHDKQSSEFRGQQWNMLEAKTYWAFHCRQDIAGYPKNSGHIFLALRDKSAPKSAEQAAEWQKKWEREMAGLTDAYDEGGRNG